MNDVTAKTIAAVRAEHDREPGIWGCGAVRESIHCCVTNPADDDAFIRRLLAAALDALRDAMTEGERPMNDDTPTCDEAISWKVTAEQVAAILDEVRAERDEARAENIRLRSAAERVLDAPRYPLHAEQWPTLSAALDALRDGLDGGGV